MDEDAAADYHPPGTRRCRYRLIAPVAKPLYAAQALEAFDQLTAKQQHRRLS